MRAEELSSTVAAASLLVLIALCPAHAEAQEGSDDARVGRTLIQYNHSPEDLPGRFRVQQDNATKEWLPRLNEITMGRSEPICVAILHPNTALYEYSLSVDTLARSTPPGIAAYVAALNAVARGEAAGEREVLELETEGRQAAAADLRGRLRTGGKELSRSYLDGELTPQEFRESVGGRDDARGQFDRVYLLSFTRALQQLADLNRRVMDSDSIWRREGWQALAADARWGRSVVDTTVERFRALLEVDPLRESGGGWVRQLRPLMKGLRTQMTDLETRVDSAAKQAMKPLLLCQRPEGKADVRVTLSITRTNPDTSSLSEDRPSREYRFTVRREDRSRLKVVPLLTLSTFFSDRIEAQLGEGTLSVRDATADVDRVLGTGLLVRAGGPLWGMMGVSSLEPDQDFGSLVFGLVLHFPDVLNFTIGAGGSYTNVPVGLKPRFSEGALPEGRAPADVGDVVDRERRLGAAFVLGLAGLKI